MFKRIFTHFSLDAVQDRSIFTVGMDKHDCLIISIALILIFIISVLKERNVPIRERIASKNAVVRFAAYYALILSIVIFGAYGTGYVPVDPIYAGF